MKIHICIYIYMRSNNNSQSMGSGTNYAQKRVLRFVLYADVVDSMCNNAFLAHAQNLPMHPQRILTPFPIEL